MDTSKFFQQNYLNLKKVIHNIFKLGSALSALSGDAGLLLPNPQSPVPSTQYP